MMPPKPADDDLVAFLAAVSPGVLAEPVGRAVSGRIPISYLLGPLFGWLAPFEVEGLDVEIDYFVKRWKDTEAAERANKDSFLKELCQVLGVPQPNGKVQDPESNTYVFEADAILVHEGGRETIGFMDLYRKDCFVLEAKQGSTKKGKKVGTARRGTPGWSAAMDEAKGQAIRYARTLDDPPPFLIVADLGYCFDIYSAFGGTGAYTAFPNAQKNRIFLGDLPKHVDLLRAIWLDPYALDPARRAERVTKQVAEDLARLATDLEKAGHDPIQVANFLMRCIFTMFAEDIGLLRDKLFTKALKQTWLPQPKSFKEGVEALWDAMNEGKSFFILGKLLHFNGGLFADPVALPLNKTQLKILISAAEHEWSEVEPAIFGTLIEGALNPKSRHTLGAYFTPKSYVERLLVPTIDEPLRAEWDMIRVRVRELVPPGEVAKPGNVKKARASVEGFHKRLCDMVVLDPACGSGNFLYLALNLFKRIESEVLATLYDLGVTQMTLGDDQTVTPRQFRGIEVRRESKEIAELVLWIGYLQWHHRMYGQTKHPPEPILRDYKNIECRDALLDFDQRTQAVSSDGEPLTRWDGETTKVHPATGADVPDDTATVPVYDYLNPRVATWPKADFIIGNPPFQGTKRMRAAFGDGYVDALRETYRTAIEDNADFVMYWWHKAALEVQAGRSRRFGFVTTNSITQSFNRRVVTSHLPQVKIVWAVPDHPWSEKGAAVRVAMTCVNKPDPGQARLVTVKSEHEAEDGSENALVFEHRFGSEIHADLRIGANVTSATPLQANGGISGMGVALHGNGFVVDEDAAESMRQAGEPSVIKRYLKGREMQRRLKERSVIDFSFMTEEEARSANPVAYQHVVDHVLPERRVNRRDSIRIKWWRFGWERPQVRRAVEGLGRYIATTETTKHRVFQFVDADVLCDHSMIVIASDDPFHLGILSSKVHVVWSLAAGGRLGKGNDPRYNKTKCFDPFPFPECSKKQRDKIAKLALEIDNHRKTRLVAEPKLTIGAMYDVLAKLATGEALSEKEEQAHSQAQASVLLRLHEQLDEAVISAYGWPIEASEEELLSRVVDLNHDRADEEAGGVVRWVRAEYQRQLEQGKAASRRRGADTVQLQLPWPSDLPSQVAAVRDMVTSTNNSLSAKEIAAAYKGATVKKVVPALETLEALGIAASFQNGTLRWKGLDRAETQPGVTKATLRQKGVAKAAYLERLDEVWLEAAEATNHKKQ